MTETKTQKINVGSDYSGVGAFDQSLMRLGVEKSTSFACDMDKFARQSYIINYGTAEDILLLQHPDVKFIDDIYYRFANSKENPPTPDEWKSLEKIEEATARRFSFYYPWNVYKRAIPEKPLDFYMTSPPCQGFSMSGLRKGSILFMNSLEFITKNKPRFFIFENVKGLLSHEKKDKKAEFGRTFNEWINYLGGKSVNGKEVIFPYGESVPYHIYFKVINSKHHGVPQNRERIFIVGIRDDSDNDFHFPKKTHLLKRLKHVLEKEVDKKYFLSHQAIRRLIYNESGFKSFVNNGDKIASTICASDYKLARGMNLYSEEIIQLNDPIHSNNRVYSDNGIAPTIKTMQGGNRQPFVAITEPHIAAIRGRNPVNPSNRSKGIDLEQKLEINMEGISNTLTTVQKDNVLVIPCNTKKGFEILTEEDSLDLKSMKSKTRRGAVGKGVSQNLDTDCYLGVISNQEPVIIGYTRDAKGKVVSYHEKEEANTITTSTGGGGNTDQFVNMKESASKTRIRRLTPRECMRLMDFPDLFLDKIEKYNSENPKYRISDSQIYKQSGNSIVVEPLKLLLEKLLK